MTNVFANFDQIMEFAKSYGSPQVKKRAIVREYLQTKIISLLYTQKLSKNLYFVGGTALRLMHGLDRFSEDLDFDAPDLSRTEIKNLVSEVAEKLKRENILFDFYHNPKEKRDYYELRFKDLLFETKISSNREERLMVKLDFETFWRGQKREAVFLNRYGFLTTVVTKTLNQFLVEKLVAYLGRAQTQARDIYDIVWLGSHAAAVDEVFAKLNGYSSKDLISRALTKFLQEKTTLLKASLLPFLLNEEDASRIDFFPRLFYKG